MAPAAGAGSSRCSQRRGPLSPWPPARSRRALSAPHRRPNADSATPLVGEAAPAQGGGGGGRPEEGSSGTEAERGRKGGGAVGNGDEQGRGWPRSDPRWGGWLTAKARSTARLWEMLSQSPSISPTALPWLEVRRSISSVLG
ncbi:uncharacterized protein LOC116091785 [Mastomys coucha]|uniref:uncharacterized protein LOC116091785 n=1 Tax=Mastomys coucha TaxID=35658 RepID=UPI0012614504|nr:uncharacterized protein LOC116091785 [Mastomys coucha]